MPDLNKEAVINGTPKKVIRRAFEVMKENHNIDTAETYYETYKEFPISVLLENSRYIFAEPIRGYQYYKEMMSSGCIPFVEYVNERDKIKSFMMEHATIMNEETKKWYQSLYEFVDDLFQNHKNCAIAEHVLDEDMDHVMTFLSESYAYVNGSDNHDAVVEAYEGLSPMAQILYTAENAKSLDLEYEVMESISQMYEDCVVTESMNKFSNGLHLTMLLNRIGQDKSIQESVNQYDNKRLKSVFNGLARESVVDGLTDSIVRHLNPEPIMDQTIAETVSNLMELQVEDSDGFYEEHSHIKEYDNILRKFIAYENCLEDVTAQSVFSSPEDLINGPELVREYAVSKGYDPDTVTILDGINLITEAVAELGETLTYLEDAEYMREYRTDGKQTSVIKRHASDLMEEDNPKAKKNSKPDQWKDSVGGDEDKDDEDNGDAVANEVNEEEETNKKDDKDKQDEKPAEKPKAPKQSFHSKVQAKALEADMKMKHTGGKLKKFATDVKQTGKAILKVPGNIVNGAKSLLESWKSWSDERKKEQILKPGFRKSFWAKFRAVVAYGVSFAIHPYMVIVTFMVRHAAAENNRYLRNELALELQTEIKVMDAKIEDASRDEKQQKAKYQLMRIRDKLEKERVRVVSNSKFV